MPRPCCPTRSPTFSARLVFDGALEIDEVKDIWDDLAAVGLVLHPFNPPSHRRWGWRRHSLVA
jgi:hypothetical protein